jgi:DNA topoisomerase IB
MMSKDHQFPTSDDEHHYHSNLIKMPSCPTGLLVRRTGSGRDNHKYSNSEHAYPESLGIPPIYASVDVCKPGGKVLYIAKDSRGRTQTKYTTEHNDNREGAVKPEHFRKLTPEIWNRLSGAVSAELKKTEWSVEKLAAAAVLLIQSCFFRPGTRSAKGEDAHFGVVTLLVRHVTGLHGDACHFEFIGKSGKSNKCSVDSTPHLCAILKQLTKNKRGSDRLFRFGKRTLDIGKLRDFLKRATFTKPDIYVKPKDVRTYGANIAFLSAFRDLKDDKSRLIKAVKSTSEKLNNTPTIAKKSYILAPVISAAEDGELKNIPAQANKVGLYLNALLNSNKRASGR